MLGLGLGMALGLAGREWQSVSIGRLVLGGEAGLPIDGAVSGDSVLGGDPEHVLVQLNTEDVAGMQPEAP
jgi:hypothetical protein